MPDDLIEVPQSRRTSLRDLCCIFCRYKLEMLLFLIASVAYTAIFTITATKVYQSEAKLLVRLGRESVTLDPTATTGQIVPVVASREAEMLTELEILRSHKMAEKVVDLVGEKTILHGSGEASGGIGTATPGSDNPVKAGIRAAVNTLKVSLQRFGLRQPVEGRDKAVMAIIKNVAITTEKDTSNIIGIRFEAGSPRLAQKVVTTLVDAYLEEHASVHTTPGSYEFFAAQSNLLRGQLGDLEGQLKKLGNGISVSSMSEEIRVTLERVGHLESEVDRAESSTAASRARVQKLRDTLAALPETIVTSTTTGFPNRASETMRELLYELRLKEQDLMSKYNVESRQVQDIRRQIAEAQALASRELPALAQTTSALNSARQQVENTLLTEQASFSSLEAEANELKGNLTEARAHLRSLNDTAAEMTRLKREMDIHETNYLKYAQNLEQARIDQALDTGRISNIKIVQPATLPIKPVRPRATLQMLLGCFFGFFGAIVLAFAAEYFNHTIRTPREVEEKLQLPTLAYVPRARANTIRPAAKRGRRTQDDGESEYVAAAPWDIPPSVKGHYEMLSGRIASGLNGWGRGLRLLAITGLHRGEGVSTVAANLASGLSRVTDGGVLLVDANLARPCQHRIFGISAQAGLVDVLSNGDICWDVIFPSPVENLYLMPAGATNGDGAEAVKPAELARLLKHLRKNYRYVVVDMPALEEADWVIRVLSLCDGVGLVVEAEKCRWEAIQAVKERLLLSKAKVLGVVLNKRRFPVPRWLYDSL